MKLQLKDCSCVVVYVLFISYLFVWGATLFYRGDFEEYLYQLKPSQRKIYEKIKKERLSHYLTGLSIGTLLSLFAFFLIDNKKNKLCISGIILLTVSSFVYYMLPKSDYMIKHLITRKQKMAWMNISTNFRKKKMFGLLVGVITYLFISYYGEGDININKITNNFGNKTKSLVKNTIQIPATIFNKTIGQI